MPIVKPEDKILIIAPHPDDEAIAVGGFIAKYHKQIDILCPNSSGKKYKWDKLSAEEIAQIRINQFYSTAKTAGVNKVYIEKLWGDHAGIVDMEKCFKNYISKFNVKDYDIILVPHKNDDHPEHRWVGNELLKKMMRTQGYKESLKIIRYELWSPIQKPNYYEDITDFIDKKRELILSYVNRGEKYLDRILGLNKYRSLHTFIAQPEKYVEAFYIENIEEYLNPDIINKNTDKNFYHEKFEHCLREVQAQIKIDKLAKMYKDKRIVLYGAGEFARCLFKNYDLSKLNIIGISDIRFQQDRPHEFYGLNCIAPINLKEFDFDLILILNYNYANLYTYLTKELLAESEKQNIEIKSIIKNI